MSENQVEILPKNEVENIEESYFYVNLSDMSFLSKKPSECPFEGVIFANNTYYRILTPLLFDWLNSKFRRIKELHLSGGVPKGFFPPIRKNFLQIQNYAKRMWGGTLKFCIDTEKEEFFGLFSDLNLIEPFFNQVLRMEEMLITTKSEEVETKYFIEKWLTMTKEFYPEYCDNKAMWLTAAYQLFKEYGNLLYMTEKIATEDRKETLYRIVGILGAELQREFREQESEEEEAL